MPYSSFKDSLDTILGKFKEYSLFGGSEENFNIIVFVAYEQFVKRGVITNPKTEIIDEINKRIKHYYEEDYSSIEKELSNLSIDEIKETVLTCAHRILRGSFGKRYDGVSCNLIEQLTYQFLKFDNNDVFCDYGSGLGLMLIDEYLKAQEDGKGISLSGIEMNYSYVLISEALIAVLSEGKAPLEIKTDDLFHSDIGKCNKGYVYPPYGVRSQDDMIYSNLFPHLKFKPNQLSQWAYVDRMLSDIDFEHGGRGVALLFTHSFVRPEGKEYLDKLVEANLIEGVIKLPPVLLDTSITPYLVVFSAHNEGITFVNGTNEDFCPNLNKNLARHHIEENYNVDELINAYTSHGGEYAIYLSNDEIKNISSWDPELIISSSKHPSKTHYIPLSEMAEVLVGAQYTISYFKTAKGITGYKILTSKDIEDGMINWNGLQSLEMEKTLFDRYAVKENDVIITSKSSKVKTAVVDINPEEKVIVTGGMIIVRPDTNKLNPNFLKMYLDSDEGQDALKEIQTGTYMIHLSPKAVENLKIPPLSLAEQTKLSIMYTTKLVQLNSYKEKVAQIQEDLNSIINGSIQNSIIDFKEKYMDFSDDTNYEDSLDGDK